MATEVASNSEILSSPEQPSRINSLSSNDDCIELMTRAYAKGTIHILRKHLYILDKLNLTSNSPNLFFHQNKRIYFSTLHIDEIFIM